MRMSHSLVYGLINLVFIFGTMEGLGPTASQAAGNGNTFRSGQFPLCGKNTRNQRLVLYEDGTEVCDNTTGLYWQQSPSPTTLTWDQAIDYCAGLTLNGRTWRLPQFEELITLVNFREPNQAVVLNAPNGPFANVVWRLEDSTLVFYWASTPDPADPDNNAFDVDFRFGGVFSESPKDSSLGPQVAWCVHDGR